MNPEDIRRVGRWPVRRLLGQGGFSWVFEVVDEKLGVARALKMLRPEAARGEQFKRFWREARLLASFSDPHLVTIYELDQDPDSGCHYYVMELFTGTNLENALAEEPEGRFDWAKSVEIFLGILQALDHLHGHRPDPIIHRDIKPSNIQLTAEGLPKLFDLGIARVMRQTDATVGDSTALTSAHSFIGTPKYASPEQLEGRELGTESDVFSLGLCLYQALAGRHLYESISDLDTQSYQSIHRYMVIAEHRRTELPITFPRKLGIPAAVQQVVQKALRLQPADRFADAGAMREALAASREATAGAREGPGRRLPGIAAVALLVLLGVGVFWIARPRVEQWLGAREEKAARLGEVESLEKTARDAQVRVQTGGTVDVKAFEDAMAAAGQALSSGQTAMAAGKLAVAKEQLGAADRGYARALLIQQAALERDQATAMRSDIQKMVDTGTLDAGAAQPFRDAFQEGENAWAAGSYGDAEHSYRAALSSGKAVLPSVAGEVQGAQGKLGQEFAALDAARKRASDSGAERAAAAAFHHADDLSARARAARDDGRDSDAAALSTQATDAYAAAAKESEKALAEARGAMGSADAAATQLGDCSRLSSRAAAPCRDGAVALAAGKTALETSEAAEALQKFREAQQQFELAATAIHGGRQRPVLTLDVHGRLHLKVGDHRTIHAMAKAPTGSPVTITFALTDPRGRKREHTGTSFSFDAKRSGDYKLEAVARDARGEESRPERVTLRVSRQATQPRANRSENADSGVAQTLSEYAAAIKAKDIHSLGVVYRMNPGVRNFFDTLFDKYAGLDVTTYILSQEVHGDTASIRFTQTLRGINPDGSFTPIVQGRMKAELLRRPDGWQITSLRAVD